MTNKYFKFHSSCVIVNGKENSNIYDLRRGGLYTFPNSVIEVFQDYSSGAISKLLEDYSEQKETINKYLDFFIENELIFFIENPKDLANFPEINRRFNKPYDLDIILLEIDNFDFLKKSLFKNNLVSELGCTELVLIGKSDTKENLKDILNELNKTKIQTVTYFIDEKYYSETFFNDLINNNLRLREIIVYNSSKESDVFETENSVFFSSEDLRTLLTRRITSIDDLVPNLDSFVESQEHNLFYNRRVYIDNDNFVKHAFEENETFGNLSDITIIEIIQSSKFRKLWFLNKNKISVCKDCGLRYICPDNRIPIKKEDSEEYYHNIECNYNPYKNKWK